METVRGNFGEALRLAEAALAKVDSVDRWNAALIREQLAGLRAWAGQKEAALEELQRSLREPGGALVHPARHSFFFVPLHGDPRFEQLLVDPKNNAPLF